MTSNRKDGRIERRIREWITNNVPATTQATLRDVCSTARRVDEALSLGMNRGLARRAIRKFVARVLIQNHQQHA